MHRVCGPRAVPAMETAGLSRWGWPHSGTGEGPRLDGALRAPVERSGRRDRVVRPEEVGRVERPLHLAEPPVHGGRVEPCRVDPPLGEVQVRAIVVVRARAPRAACRAGRGSPGTSPRPAPSRPRTSGSRRRTWTARRGAAAAASSAPPTCRISAETSGEPDSGPAAATKRSIASPSSGPSICPSPVYGTGCGGIHVQLGDVRRARPSRTCPSPGRGRGAASGDPPRRPRRPCTRPRRSRTCRLAAAPGSRRAAGTGGCGRPR